MATLVKSYCSLSSSSHAQWLAVLARIFVFQELLEYNMLKRCSEIMTITSSILFFFFFFVFQASGEGFKFTKRAMDGAAAAGHLEMVKWLHGKDEECTTDAMDGAAEEGQLDVVKVR